MKDISVKIIADSVSAHTGTRITTYELEYHRYIHSEFMTHRVFSRNAASSRAIPVATMIDMVRKNPVTPVFLGKNKSGMQATEEVDDPNAVMRVWNNLAVQVANGVEELNKLGLHKQVANRPLEAFQRIKTVMTTTDRANWYYLRYHESAQPEIVELAKLMQEADDCSKPVVLHKNQWHMPYVFNTLEGDEQVFFDEHNSIITLEQALTISSSCCAQVSYRKNDGSLEKAETVYKRLIESKPCHASPTEHQAKPVDPTEWFPEGCTHITRKGVYYSGNLRNWIQHRQLIKDHVKYD